MAEKHISVNLGTEKVKLSSNTPDIDSLIEKVVKLKNKINIEEIKVESEDQEFDKDGFELVIKNSIKKFLEDIKINEDKIKIILDEKMTD